jgi:hypothetical protein
MNLENKIPKKSKINNKDNRVRPSMCDWYFLLYYSCCVHYTSIVSKDLEGNDKAL